MDSDKARLLLAGLKASRDTEIISNDKEYYIREDYPVFSFSIPKNGTLSKAKWLKLLEISWKIMKFERGAYDG